VQLSIFETTRRKTDETYDNRTCYNFRTLRQTFALAQTTDVPTTGMSGTATGSSMNPTGSVTGTTGSTAPSRGRNASGNTLMPNRSPSGSTLPRRVQAPGSVGKKESPPRDVGLFYSPLSQRNGPSVLSGIALGPFL
jgi:hypothetical protein